jgi:hypothetical protein
MNKQSNLNGNFEYELLDENQPVSDLREKLAALYANPFAEILWWELRDHSLMNQRYHKLFYYEQNVLKHIILFKYNHKAPKTIHIINKLFEISIENIENICRILYSELNRVRQIVFENLYGSDPKQTSKIVFDKTSNDVIILNLPSTMDAYMKSLGKKIQKHIKLMMNYIARDFPEFKVQFIEKNDILFEQIEKIVLLNRSRMKIKGEVSELVDSECNSIYQYAATSGFGFLCLCFNNDQIISGTINSIIGEHAYLHVIAHDNSYNRYSPGQMALVHTTKYLIEEKNIKQFHLLFGTKTYKFRHGGTNHDLYTFWCFKNNDISYLWLKTIKDLKHRLKKNKAIDNFYSKLKLKMTAVLKRIKNTKNPDNNH